MRQLIATLVMLMLVVWAADPAWAGISLEYSAGDYLATNLANDGYPSNNDVLALTGSSGTVTLSAGSPVVAPLAVFHFTSGYSSYGVVTQFFNTGATHPWQLTVDGTTQTVSMPYSVNSNYVTDTLIMQNGQSLSFPITGGNEIVTVEALGFTSYAFLNTTEGVLLGQFTLSPADPLRPSLATPEPSTLAIGETASVLGLGTVICRRRRRSNR